MKHTRKIGWVALVAATYAMVAGGPFGLEEIVQTNGYRGAILIICITPLLWALPTALMVSELASALPETGGYYVWVKRALGPFWGFQETWLTFEAAFSTWPCTPFSSPPIWPISSRRWAKGTGLSSWE